MTLYEGPIFIFIIFLMYLPLFQISREKIKARD